MGKYLAHAPGLASRPVGSEEVVVAPRSGKVWAFNAAGAFVWELADGSLGAEELAGLLARARGIDRAAAGEELEGFFADLAARGLAAWREVPCAPGRRSQRAGASPPESLPEAPRVLSEESLQVLAGGCDSSHTGGGSNCMIFGSCIAGFS